MALTVTPTLVYRDASLNSTFHSEFIYIFDWNRAYPFASFDKRNVLFSVQRTPACLRRSCKMTRHRTWIDMITGSMWKIDVARIIRRLWARSRSPLRSSESFTGWFTMTNGLRGTTSYQTTPALSSFTIIWLGWLTNWGSHPLGCSVVRCQISELRVNKKHLLGIIWLEFSICYHSPHPQQRMHVCLHSVLFHTVTSFLFHLFLFPNVHTFPCCSARGEFQI